VCLIILGVTSRLCKILFVPHCILLQRESGFALQSTPDCFVPRNDSVGFSLQSLTQIECKITKSISITIAISKINYKIVREELIRSTLIFPLFSMFLFLKVYNDSSAFFHKLYLAKFFSKQWRIFA
jgi:hypothetical protein